MASLQSVTVGVSLSAAALTVPAIDQVHVDVLPGQGDGAELAYRTRVDISSTSSSSTVGVRRADFLAVTKPCRSTVTSLPRASPSTAD